MFPGDFNVLDGLERTAGIVEIMISRRNPTQAKSRDRRLELSVLDCIVGHYFKGLH